MNRSTRSPLDVVPLMTSRKAALRASQDPSFEMARNDAHEYVSMWVWEAALNYETELWSGKATAAVNNEAPVEFKNRQIENCHTNEEDIISREAVRSEGNGFEQFVNFSQHFLDDILRKSIRNAQSGIRSVIYNIVELVILDLLRKDIIEKMLHKHIAKFFRHLCSH